jgi:diketogulonate reductase-like aldo/keto reductase
MARRHFSRKHFTSHLQIAWRGPGDSTQNANRAMRLQTFGPLQRQVPVIGQGTWQMHDRGARGKQAAAALKLGIDLGLTHIDTAEMYGDGRAEEIVADAISGLPRETLFIVSKVLPQNASYEGTIRACEGSLRRLRAEYLDVYLLHWRGSHPLEATMSAMERLVDEGKIRALGVSNFDVADLKEANEALRRYPIACNQVLYHLGERRVEHAVLPYCRANDIALVAYSPLGQGDFPSSRSPRGRVLADVAALHDATPSQVALAFLTRQPGTFAIPKAEREDHVRDNAAAGELKLSAADVSAIDVAFPPGPSGSLPMN